MKRFLAATGVTLVMVSAAATTHAADGQPEIDATVTKATSASRQTSSEINIGGTWSTGKLAVGQKFTISAVPTNGGAPFTWNASFPFTLDDGTVIGECEADSATLTCKVTEVPAAYANSTNAHGSWWARARIQSAAVGTTEGQITVNDRVVKTLVWGDTEGTGACTNDCDSTVHYEYANPSNTKFGWTNDNGTIGWAIKLIATGGAEYTVKDFDTRLDTTVRCAKSATWDPATTEIVTATQVDDNTIKFVAPEGARTCILYTPEQMRVPEGQNSLTNHAEVNGIKLEATATVQSNGSANGGATPTTEPSQPSEPSHDPKPQPSQPGTTPTTEPSQPSEPSHDPKPQPSQPGTTPTTEPSQPSEPSHDPKPQPSQPGTTPTTEPSQPSEPSHDPKPQPSQPGTTPTTEPSQPSEPSHDPKPQPSQPGTTPTTEPSQPSEPSHDPKPQPSQPGTTPTTEPSQPSEPSHDPKPQPSQPGTTPTTEPSQPSEPSHDPAPVHPVVPVKDAPAQPIQPQPERAGSLAKTGASDGSVIVAGATALTAIGATLLILARKRRNKS